MSRRNKGITGTPGLMFFTLVVVLTIAIFYIVSLIPLINEVIGLKSVARFDVVQDDRGTALAAFLKLGGASEMTYAEILGIQAAKDVDKKLDDPIEATLAKLDPDGRVAVYDGDKKVADYNYGDVGDNYLAADLALPGVGRGVANKGEVRVS